MAYSRRRSSYRARGSRSRYRARTGRRGRRSGVRRGTAQRIVIQVVNGHAGGMTPIAVTAGKKAPRTLRPRF